MKRYWVHAFALVLMWIGALELTASFLAKYWFQYTISLTPVFFLVLLTGITLYIAVRVL